LSVYNAESQHCKSRSTLRNVSDSSSIIYVVNYYNIKFYYWCHEKFYSIAHGQTMSQHDLDSQHTVNIIRIEDQQRAEIWPWDAVKVLSVYNTGSQIRESRSVPMIILNCIR
jgi:hypothetical protein